MAAAALAHGRTQRQLDARLHGPAGQQLARLRQAFPLQPTAANSAEAALRGHQHGSAGLAWSRALGLGHGDENDRRAGLQQIGEARGEIPAHATRSAGPVSRRRRSTASSTRSGVAGESRRGQMRWPAKLATASEIACRTEMPSIKGGSPTALERKMASSRFPFSNKWTLKTRGRSPQAGIL